MAIKEITIDTDKEATAQDALREGRLLRSLNSTYILTMWDVGVENDCVYLIMEYADADETQIMFQVAVDPEPIPIPNSISASMRDVLEKSLAKNPEDRFQTASELRTALVELHAVELPPETPPKISKSKTAAEYVNMGIEFRKAGEYHKAIAAYQEAIQIDPEDALAYNNMGFAYDELKQYDKAIDAYQHAIRIDPEDALAYNNMGFAYDELKQYDKAIEAYQHVIGIDPQYAHAYDNMGIAYHDLKQYDKAIDAFQHAIRIDPQYAHAYYNMSCLYSSIGEEKLSIQWA